MDDFILQEASDHVPHVSDQFIAYTVDTDLAFLLNRDTCEPNAAAFAFQEASTSQDTWGMVILVLRGLLRRPSLRALLRSRFAPFIFTISFVKKRDASTDLLRRLRAHMTQHNGDFIGGDFNI